MLSLSVFASFFIAIQAATIPPTPHPTKMHSRHTMMHHSTNMHSRHTMMHHSTNMHSRHTMMHHSTNMHGHTGMHPTTAHPHSTHMHGHTGMHEHNEHAVSTFYFDAMTHTMVMKINKQCYHMKLDDTEATKVHDKTGIVEVELMMVKMIGSATETMVSHAQIMKMSKHIAHMCPNGSMQLARS